VGLVAFVVPSNLADARPHAPRCMGHRATISGPNTHLHARGHRRVIIGTDHHDVILGGRRPEWIVGAGGSDLVCGGGGSDYVFVGNATRLDRRSRLSGGPGADYLDGSFSGDRISGGGGNDRIDGEYGADRISGDDGNDFIRAQKGADRIHGGRGADHVEASSGRDLVHGGPGDDKISTGPNDDLAFGDRGDDSLFLVWGDDVGWGGPGDDGLHGGPGEDICHGEHGTDQASGCEHRRSIEVLLPAAKPKSRAHRRGHHRPHRHPHLRHFDRVPALHRIEAFLHRLQGERAIKSPAVTVHQMRRSSALGHAVRKVVARRYEARRRGGHRVKAVFGRSVERYRVRGISAAISNQIDRLRWTPLRNR
jgi:Ca2+-binding RTX toxin-like protein